MRRWKLSITISSFSISIESQWLYSPLYLRYSFRLSGGEKETSANKATGQHSNPWPSVAKAADGSYHTNCGSVGAKVGESSACVRALRHEEGERGKFVPVLVDVLTPAQVRVMGVCSIYPTTS